MIYLPWLNEHQDPQIHAITIKHLLTHSSGLARDGSLSDFWLFKSAYPDQPRLKRTILNINLSFEPGSSVKYSNLAYGLLGKKVSKAAGQEYKRYIQNHILKPLDLRPAFIDYSSQIQPIAQGYGLPQPTTRTRMAKRTPAKSLTPAVGLYATPDVMCQFASKLCNRSSDSILKDTSKRLMQRPQSQVLRAMMPELVLVWDTNFKKSTNDSFLDTAVMPVAMSLVPILILSVNSLSRSPQTVRIRQPVQLCGASSVSLISLWKPKNSLYRLHLTLTWSTKCPLSRLSQTVSG